MLLPEAKARELLAASEQTPRVYTYFHDEEPDLVPAGMYAVVSVEFKPMDNISVTIASAAYEHMEVPV